MSNLDYPEHGKLRATKPTRDAICNFLIWAAENDIYLSKWEDDDLERRFLIPHWRQVFGDYFGIDYDVLQAEKDSMIEEQRKITEALAERSEGANHGI